MAVDFKDIVDAFLLNSFGAEGESEAYLCKNTGEIYYHSDYSDELDDLPDDIYDDDIYIVLPSKSELNLGRQLAFDFTYQVTPMNLDKVQGMFSKKGAYSKFKYLLEREGLLEKWYEFELKAQEAALREWCSSESIEING